MTQEAIKEIELEISRECYNEVVRQTGKKISYEEYISNLWLQQLKSSITRVHKLGGKIVLGIEISDGEVSKDLMAELLGIVKDGDIDGVKLVGEMFNVESVITLAVSLKGIGKDKILISGVGNIGREDLLRLVNLGVMVSVPVSVNSKVLVREIESVGGKVWLDLGIDEIGKGATLSEGVINKIEEIGLLGEYVGLDLSRVGRVEGTDWFNLWSDSIKVLIKNIESKVVRTLESYYNEWYEIGSSVEVDDVKYNKRYKELKKIKIRDEEIEGAGIQLVSRLVTKLVSLEDISQEEVNILVKEISEIVDSSGLHTDSKINSTIEKLVNRLMLSESVEQKRISMIQLKGYLEGLVGNVLYQEYVSSTNNEIYKEYKKEFAKMLVEIDSYLVLQNGNKVINVTNFEDKVIIMDNMLRLGMFNEVRDMLLNASAEEKNEFWFAEMVMRYYDMRKDRDLVDRLYEEMVSSVERKVGSVDINSLDAKSIALYYNNLVVVEELGRVVGKEVSYKDVKENLKIGAKGIVSGEIKPNMMFMINLSRVESLLDDSDKQKVISSIELVLKDSEIIEGKMLADYVRMKGKIKFAETKKVLSESLMPKVNILLTYFGINGYLPEKN